VRSGLVLALVAGTASAVWETPQSTGIDRVAWLQGCWVATYPQRTVEEQWMAPRGGSMIAMSRTVRAGRLTAHELVVLQEADGALSYQAHPSGQASAVFRSIAVSDTLLLVENPEHDFPQRIGYRRVGADSLAAWIEGRANGQERHIEFGYRRAACPPQ
jgi:hypothetical protein